CAIELARTLPVHGGRALALRLVRWQEGQDAPDTRLPDLRQFDSRPVGAAPIYVARNVATQLAGRYTFSTGQHRFPGFVALEGAVAGDQAQGTALVGRSLELRQFRAVAETAQETQAGHVVFVRGVAGVGKSRLTQEFAELARHLGFRHHSCSVQDANAE